jgi:hypothetical protein
MSKEIKHIIHPDGLEGQQDRNLQAPYHNRYPGIKKEKKYAKSK